MRERLGGRERRGREFYKGEREEAVGLRGSGDGLGKKKGERKEKKRKEIK